MKILKTIFIFLLTSQVIFAQKATKNGYARIDRKALRIPDSLTKTSSQIADYITSNFSTDKDKSRAIFIWVTSNIQYDIDNMFGFTLYESKEDIIAKTLRTRKGVCENYALLFSEICRKSGIKSFEIEGYTKQHGEINSIPHAWSAALIDSSWFLFDPTWGSGFIDDRKFIKRINYYYFKVSPSKLIKSHMPFDYLWQFLNYPVSNQDFSKREKQQNETIPYFNFKDSIYQFLKQTRIEQLFASAYRIEKNGVINSIVSNKLQTLKKEIENERQNVAINQINAAVIDYNDGIKAMNDYLKFWNKQFTPEKPDSAIQQMLDIVQYKLNEAKSKFEQIANPKENIFKMILHFKKEIETATIQLNEQQDWLKQYFSKSKWGRKYMFYKW